MRGSGAPEARPLRSSRIAPQPQASGALHIVLDAVADHHRGGGGDVKRAEHGLEQRRGGLHHADLALDTPAQMKSSRAKCATTSSRPWPRALETSAMRTPAPRNTPRHGTTSS